MRVKFQQRCVRCRKNLVPMHSGRQFPICSQCQMKEINQPIESKKMAKFFDIPLTLYEQSSFLRSIKSQYLRFGSLTTAQRSTFIKVVKELKDPKLQAERAAKLAKSKEMQLSSNDDSSSSVLLVNAIKNLLEKDTPTKRRALLTLLSEYQRQPITSEKLLLAVHALASKSRGRPKLLLMTPDEIRYVLAGLEV